MRYNHRKTCIPRPDSTICTHVLRPSLSSPVITRIKHVSPFCYGGRPMDQQHPFDNYVAFRGCCSCAPCPCCVERGTHCSPHVLIAAQQHHSTNRRWGKRVLHRHGSQLSILSLGTTNMCPEAKKKRGVSFHRPPPTAALPSYSFHLQPCIGNVNVSRMYVLGVPLCFQNTLLRGKWRSTTFSIGERPLGPTQSLHVKAVNAFEDALLPDMP